MCDQDYRYAISFICQIDLSADECRYVAKITLGDAPATSNVRIAEAVKVLQSFPERWRYEICLLTLSATEEDRGSEAVYEVLATGTVFGERFIIDTITLVDEFRSGSIPLLLAESSNSFRCVGATYLNEARLTVALGSFPLPFRSLGLVPGGTEIACELNPTHPVTFASVTGASIPGHLVIPDGQLTLRVAQT